MVLGDWGGEDFLDIMAGVDALCERDYVDADRLAAMQPGALLINTSRGALVDETAVLEALLDGHLGGYGVDTFDQIDLHRSATADPPDHPLLQLPNVDICPPETSNLELIRRSEAVLASTGTAGLEAIVLGKRVEVLGRHYNSVFEVVKRGGWKLRRLEHEKLSLEEVFLGIVGGKE